MSITPAPPTIAEPDATVESQCFNCQEPVRACHAHKMLVDYDRGEGCAYMGLVHIRTSSHLCQPLPDAERLRPESDHMIAMPDVTP